MLAMRTVQPKNRDPVPLARIAPRVKSTSHRRTAAAYVVVEYPQPAGVARELDLLTGGEGKRGPDLLTYPHSGKTPPVSSLFGFEL